VLAHLGSHIAKHGDGAVQDLAIWLVETVDVNFIDSAAGSKKHRSQEKQNKSANSHYGYYLVVYT
jgi:hypothetical protein